MSYLAAPHRFSFGLRMAAWVILSPLVVYFWWGIEKEHFLIPAGSGFFAAYFMIPAVINSGTAYLLGLVDKERLGRSIAILGLAIASPVIFTMLLLTVGCMVAVGVFH